MSNPFEAQGRHGIGKVAPGPVGWMLCLTTVTVSLDPSTPKLGTCRSACGPTPAQSPISRLTSFRNRQSVPRAMILSGLDLMMPSSCNRSA